MTDSAGVTQGRVPAASITTASAAATSAERRRRAAGTEVKAEAATAPVSTRPISCSAVRIARYVHPETIVENGGPGGGPLRVPAGMSWGVVEGPKGAPDDGLTVSSIAEHPFGAIRFTGARWAMPDVRLVAPILPSKVVAVGKNYADHVAEMGGEVPPSPVIFLKPSTSIIGAGDAIRLPTDAGVVHHEAELAIVLGKPLKNAAAATARAAVLGFTCANDVTDRDMQKADGQWARAKGFDSFCPIGPWIETAIDPADLAIRAQVNGQLRQDGRTSQMVHGVGELLAFMSHVMTLLPGDVVLTGTPAGVGPIEPGDTVSVEIEGIGVLTNAVVRA